MTSTTDTRSNWRTWSPAYETAPPAACQTLRNLNKVVEWGYTCVFGEENGDPVPFSINTACMPWVTPNVYPSSGAFYSPATACPTSWNAVSTATSGLSNEQWVDGETGLICCPPGFEGDGRAGCKVRNSGTVPVVQCGEADAEENELRTYTGAAWPASVSASVTPLRLRYRASDIGSASATGTSGAGTSNPGGLSTGAKAAIGTVIPLVFIIGALAFFLLWRRRKQKTAAMGMAVKPSADEKGKLYSESRSGSTSYHQPIPTPTGILGAAAAVPVHGTSNNTLETPEWNVEMDAVEAERQGLIARHEYSPSGRDESNAAQPGGMVRLPRKPIQPVEIDGNPEIAEVGDAYIPYRPGDDSHRV